MKRIVKESIFVLSISAALSFQTSADEPFPSPQYDLQLFGNATAISEDDYLRDGDFSNGELVNGSIYFSEADAKAGVQRDREEARRYANAVPEDTAVLH